MLILALDLGTSSCRSALFDETGTRCEETLHQIKYQLDTDPHGKVELRTARLLEDVLTCLRTTLFRREANAALSSQPIAAVGTSCFGHSLMGIDQQGQAATPIYIWSDSRSREVVTLLRKQHNERSIHALSGCMLHTSYWPAKLRWLAETYPDIVRRVRFWMSPAEWIYLQLCGQLRVAHGMVTGTGLYNPTTRAYDPALLELAGVSEDSLPRISDSPLRFTSKDNSIAGDLAPLQNALWFPAIYDGAASNLGSGATEPGLAAINVGTSAAVRILRHGDGPAPFGLFRYRVDTERYVVGGPISNAGNLHTWCLRVLKLDEATIESELEARRDARHGLRVLPFWTAERSPTWPEVVGGAVVGITESTSAMDLLQAITEASFQRLARVVDCLLGDNREVRFIVGGGIQNSPASLQRLADVLGRPLIALNELEASLRGAAVFALEKLGHRERILPVMGLTVEPHPERARRYAAERPGLVQFEESILSVIKG